MSEESYLEEISIFKQPCYEPVGRMMEDAFDQPCRIILSKNYWDYFDWLKSEDVNVEKLVKDLDKTEYKGCCLSEKLMIWLWEDGCDRHRNGPPYPPFPKPFGYEE